MNPTGTTATSRLGDIVGNANVISDPGQLAAYEIDGKIPSAAMRPATAAEVAAIVKFAASEKLAIVASGARTKLEMGFAPSRYDLALDMTRLDRVSAYDPGDLTLSVEAGVPLHALGQTLAEHRQFLPLAVPFMSQTTIGGLIASGVDSPLRHFYGTARDFLLGHLKVELGIVFQLFPGATFSDGALKAIDEAKRNLFREDWKRVFDEAAIAESIAKITRG